MKVYPGRIIKCKVDSILWVMTQGQMPISGYLPHHSAHVGLPEDSASQCDS